jgi:integrase
MARINLTDRKVATLAVTGGRARQDYWDSVVPGFGVRVTDKGARTYTLAGRFGGSKFFARREIGKVGALTLSAARDKAREWIALASQGRDPKLEEARVKREQATKLAHSFESVAADFVAWCRGPDETRPRQRQWREVARQVDILVTEWRGRPIVDIERDEIIALVRRKATTAPHAARNLLGVVKSLLGWAREQNYALRYNAAADIRPGRILGDKVARDRVLDEHELRALWAASGRMGYPIGPVYQMLVLSGLRLGEVARATWDEIDLDGRLWTIPSSRMKGRNGRVQPHVVPLTPRMVEVFASLPRFKSGPYIFSTTFGRRPVVVGAHIKDRLDAELRFKTPWRNHDIRRGVRSGLASLGIADPVAESILAHVPPGIRATYNRHNYLEERRTALKRWSAFIDPPPQSRKVVKLSERRRAHA